MVIFLDFQDDGKMFKIDAKCTKWMILLANNVKECKVKSL